MLVGSVLFGADDVVIPFVASRTFVRMDKAVSLGIVRRGALVGGVVFQNYRTTDIEIVVALDAPDGVYPGTLRTLFAYPFEQLGVARLTAIVGRKNKRARTACERLGFKLEGCCRRALDGKQDAMIYGMLRSECRFLRN